MSTNPSGRWHPNACLSNKKAWHAIPSAGNPAHADASCRRRFGRGNVLSKHHPHLLIYERVDADDWPWSRMVSHYPKPFTSNDALKGGRNGVDDFVDVEHSATV